MFILLLRVLEVLPYDIAILLSAAGAKEFSILRVSRPGHEETVNGL